MIQNIHLKLFSFMGLFCNALREFLTMSNHILANQLSSEMDLMLHLAIMLFTFTMKLNWTEFDVELKHIKSVIWGLAWSLDIKYLLNIKYSH